MICREAKATGMIFEIDNQITMDSRKKMIVIKNMFRFVNQILTYELNIMIIYNHVCYNCDIIIMI